ncbi:ATP synthase subunit epsilon [Rufibacter sp. DG15C]|jgi:F-type H+-transporting ATPase subunit epsilon|uniref:ATP synthase F1 subunit epsilon n=1 Tax=Rufibacter sp. DG15C TaxID=1379909 RepID=UPI00078D8058|nr:ATP synthase F1 subunit epsilon [Rufibacter sp. DG15C]AMM50344.1 ATP synthase subunit epsilon [Rufibacter sp. DG15C]
MYLEIITPDKRVFEGDVTSVQFPGINGGFEVLNNHAAIISALANGPVRVTPTTGTSVVFQIDGGVVEVLDNKIIVLAEAVTA